MYERYRGELTVPRLERIVSNCQQLLKHYRRRTTLRDCPLCKDFLGKEVSCKVCPWFVIEGSGCSSAARKFKASENIQSLRIKRKRSWSRMRVNQLKNWIKIISGIIEERKCAE